VTVGGEVLAITDVLTNLYGGVLLATLVHDVGEEGVVGQGDPLAITLTDPFGEVALSTTVAVVDPPRLQVPGFNVDEVQPPHIYAADASGTPQNAFAVGGSGGPEVRGPVHVAGTGFPDMVAGGVVDVYVVRDGDEWRDGAIPTAGDPRYIAGPVAVPVDASGDLVPTAVFTPDLPHVGVFDLLVDIDRNGRFEWTFNLKDGADGLARVGFTIQYSQTWLAERTSQHLLVNIAYDSHERDGGSWRNEFTSADQVFLYLNPPVMHQYHFSVTKVIVGHRDFETFWNDPAHIDPACGGVPYGEMEVRSMALVTERGCTNTSPTCFGPVPELTDGGEGCYDVGEDLLDIVGGIEGGGLVSVESFLALAAADRVGFRVRP
jgi:hypothetical protein